MQEVTCGLYCVHRFIFFIEFLDESAGDFSGEEADKNLSDDTMCSCGFSGSGSQQWTASVVFYNRKQGCISVAYSVFVSREYVGIRKQKGTLASFSFFSDGNVCGRNSDSSVCDKYDKNTTAGCSACRNFLLPCMHCIGKTVQDAVEGRTYEGENRAGI